MCQGWPRALALRPQPSHRHLRSVLGPQSEHDTRVVPPQPPPSLRPSPTPFLLQHSSFPFSLLPSPLPHTASTRRTRCPFPPHHLIRSNLPCPPKSNYHRHSQIPSLSLLPPSTHNFTKIHISATSHAARRQARQSA
eukprot:5896210-Pleurochrysis_carterae.AAC.1